MIDIETLSITPQILKLIAEIDEFKGAWQQLGRLSPDRLLALKKIATIESIGSSTRIEGAKLSDQEIEKLLSQEGIAKLLCPEKSMILNQVASGSYAATVHTTRPTPSGLVEKNECKLAQKDDFDGQMSFAIPSQVKDHSFQSRDEQEVGGYAFASEEIYKNFASIPVSENAFKQIHLWLLQYCDLDERHRGEYKKIPIRIEAFSPQGASLGVVFETTSPLETPIQMHDLINWTRSTLEENVLHPLLVIALFVVIFLAIHPFQDGNGRISRLLTTLLMLKSGYQYVPYSSLESVIEANKEGYYLALQKTQKSWQNGSPDWSPWLLFFFQSLQRQKHHLELKLTNEKILLKQLPELSQNILELIKKHGRLTISNIEAFTHHNRNTIKKHLASLVDDQYIVLNGKGKGSFYTLT